jgi:hemoglobin
MKEPTLYKRLGSYDTIAALTDDFLARLIAHEQMQRFFFGASESTRTRRRQYIVDFLCSKTGGPCAYTGRSMKEAHKGLQITETDWNTLIRIFLDSLQTFNLQDREVEELVALIASTKQDIVEKF